MTPSNATLLTQLETWIKAQEGEHFEFKEAKNKYQFEKLAKYCCALANEGGGKILLGVTDKRPREIVGSKAFPQPEQTRRSLRDRIPLLIDVEEIQHPKGRVLVFDIPSRPVGVAIQYDGTYWARETDSLVSMDSDRLRAIFAESGRDFSSEPCPGANLSDLDETAVEDFRRRWIDKAQSQNQSALAEQLRSLSREQLLRDAELLEGENLNFAALVLFGTRQALGRFLGQAEVVFEYRSSDATGPAQQRTEFRQGFFSFYEALWQTINLRNDSQHYQSGLFVLDIPTFAERSVREAIMNAVCHRDYQLGGSIFVKQYPRRLVIDSPGGFPVGITVDNMLDRQSPRNRRIAEALAKCGLVERAGQGMNLMFEQSIQQGKGLPDFSGTDVHNVSLTLSGELRDPQFVQFLEKVGKETQRTFSTHDFLVLDLIHREQPLPQSLNPRLKSLRDLGVIERVGRRYLLSKRFYSSIGERGAYTRRRGLDQEENKALLLRHLRSCTDGCAMVELQQVLPSRSRGQIKTLLDKLRKEGKIRLEGQRRGAKWHLA